MTTKEWNIIFKALSESSPIRPGAMSEKQHVDALKIVQREMQAKLEETRSSAPPTYSGA